MGQAACVWDVRSALSAPSAASVRRNVSHDYRYGVASAFRNGAARERGKALMTLSGHVVARTLIHANFAPRCVGERYTYSGSADGSIVIWDLAQGGKVVSRLQ